MGKPHAFIEKQAGTALFEFKWREDFAQGIGAASVQKIPRVR